MCVGRMMPQRGISQEKGNINSNVKTKEQGNGKQNIKPTACNRKRVKVLPRRPLSKGILLYRIYR